jgi:transcriptional regulator with XRE-family HTH domain
MASFPKKASNPVLQPMVTAILAAMRERKMTINDVADAMGLEVKQRAAVYHWTRGDNAPGDVMRPKLAAALGLTEAQLTPGGARPRLGPAQRAVALVQAAPPGAVTTVAAEPVRDVFTIAGRSDGQITVQLRATLDAGRGMALARFLLDFGLIVGDEPAANEKGAGIAAGARGRD